MRLGQQHVWRIWDDRHSRPEIRERLGANKKRSVFECTKSERYRAIVAPLDLASNRVWTMRGFLLILAVFTPVVLINPIFWWLVGTEIGASPVTAIEADGTPTHSQLGPKAPWPDWAEKPEGATVAVKAWFKPTPPRPETGFGEISYRGDGRVAVAAYARQLRAAGWNVETWTFRSASPSLQPRPFTECHLEARRSSEGDTRALSASFGLEPGANTGRLHWFTSPPAPWQAPKGEPC